MDRAELIITALQQRIGEMASGYESQIAMLRAEITLLANQAEGKKAAEEKYNEDLMSKVSSVN
jgi:hypothetical protein